VAQGSLYLRAPRKPVVPDPSKLGKEEKRTLEITESTPKGATPEKALAQLIKDKAWTLAESAWTISYSADDLPEDRLVSGRMPSCCRHRCFFRYVRMIKTPEEIQRFVNPPN